MENKSAKKAKKKKKKEKKKRSEEEWVANATLVACHRHYSRNRDCCPGDFIQDLGLLIRPQPGRSFNMFNFRSVNAVHWIIWHSVVNVQNVENRLNHA